MRQTDRPEDQPALPAPIRKPAEPIREKWTPMPHRKGYEQNERGDVRRVLL